MRDHDHVHDELFDGPDRGPGGKGGHGGRRRRHGGFGGKGDGVGPMGPGSMHGRGRGGRRGPGGGRPRGDVRAAILVLLAEQPRHGYDLIREIQERSGGAWTPSPGSIYPTLQSLEDEGLVSIDTVDGRRSASLTDGGRDWVAGHAAEHEGIFEASAAAESLGALRAELGALKEAAVHVARVPGGDLTPQAIEILAEARKRLYRLLAEQD
ncbi:PadR family transcriptional regulator [Demequina capsici]|uniref:PadR family transcriptional regulator n=1 Tax=Demequina capsici TaxID=3075620 RepID=A0AA96JEG4_9MICO|nr:PadR family transcriptional regulator [Demequina sp. OYTSA14]WNM25604.1 PadR family transcriptional regulator [Demequina sp. OYTSA14]